MAFWAAGIAPYLAICRLSARGFEGEVDITSTGPASLGHNGTWKASTDRAFQQQEAAAAAKEGTLHGFVS